MKRVSEMSGCVWQTISFLFLLGPGQGKRKKEDGAGDMLKIGMGKGSGKHTEGEDYIHHNSQGKTATHLPAAA